MHKNKGVIFTIILTFLLSSLVYAQELDGEIPALSEGNQDAGAIAEAVPEASVPEAAPEAEAPAPGGEGVIQVVSETGEIIEEIPVSDTPQTNQNEALTQPDLTNPDPTQAEITDNTPNPDSNTKKDTSDSPEAIDNPTTENTADTTDKAKDTKDNKDKNSSKEKSDATDKADIDTLEDSEDLSSEELEEEDESNPDKTKAKKTKKSKKSKKGSGDGEEELEDDEDLEDEELEDEEDLEDEEEEKEPLDRSLHNLHYTYNDDGTHTVTCEDEDCDLEEFIEDCEYDEEGTCIYCGAQKPKLECEHSYIYESNGDGTHTVKCEKEGCDMEPFVENCEFDGRYCIHCGYKRLPNPEDVHLTFPYTFSLPIFHGIKVEKIKGDNIVIKNDNDYDVEVTLDMADIIVKNSQSASFYLAVFTCNGNYNEIPLNVGENRNVVTILLSKSKSDASVYTLKDGYGKENVQSTDYCMISLRGEAERIDKRLWRDGDLGLNLNFTNRALNAPEDATFGVVAR